MKKKSEFWAVVPARSGSKGFPGKNVSLLNNLPLLAHSILFAKNLPFIDKVLLSTDSEDYAEIGRKYGAEVPFLRSKKAAEDYSMEEDVLSDIFLQCQELGIASPDHLLWLRPTHPIRETQAFINGHEKYMNGDCSSVCIVTPEDPRIFHGKDGFLTPVTSDFSGRSMVRRQDCQPAYRIFSGEFFPMPKIYSNKFLGEKIGFVVQAKDCRFDIDHKEDLDYLNYLLSTEAGWNRYGHMVQGNQA